MDETTLERIERKLDLLVETLKRFQPLLDRYEQVSAAGSFRAARKAMKQ